MAGFKSVRLAYNTYEPSTGVNKKLAPIIYLHGMSGLKEYWFDIPQKVADVTKRKSYSIDARNHGDSEWSDDFNFDVNVEDLIHFMDIHGIQKTILVGHSMGGVTAIKTALRMPERIEIIVVEDMVVRKIPKTIIGHLVSMMKILRPVMKQCPKELSNEEAIKFIFKHLLDNAPPEMKGIMENLHKEEKVENYSVLLTRDAEGRPVMKSNTDAIEKAIADYDNLCSEPKGKFDGPALFICGTTSFLKVVEDEEHIKQFFPNAKFESIEADHSVHTNKPSEFIDAVLRFLS